MKKIFYVFLTIIFVAILFFTLHSFFNINSVYIKNLNIDSLLQKNGDLNVNISSEYFVNGNCEVITLKIPKEFNKLQNNFNIKNNTVPDSFYSNDDILNFKIKVNGIEFTKSENGFYNEIGVYYEKTEHDVVTYTIHYPFTNEGVTFNISYTLSNIAIKHIDSGELFWNFVNGRYDVPINNLNINMSFEDPTNIQSAYIEGQKNSTVSINNNSIYANIKDLGPYERASLRTLFDKSSIQDSNKLSDVEIIPIINNFENSLAKTFENQKNYNSAIIILIIILLLYYLFLLIKYERDRLFVVYNKNDFELLNSDNPMILACIAENREMNYNDIIAVLIDLVNRDVLSLKVIKNENSKTYQLTKKESNVDLDNIEKIIVETFFENSNTIDLTFKIRNLVESNKNINKFKLIDKAAIEKLYSIGANSKKMPSKLLKFNKIIFILACIIIFLNSIYNFTVPYTIFQESSIGAVLQYRMFLIMTVFTLIFILPFALYGIYIVLNFIQKIIGYGARFAFRFSYKKLTYELFKYITISLIAFIFILFTIRADFVVLGTILFMVALIIAKTDHLMSKHDNKLYKKYLELNMIKQKIKSKKLFEGNKSIDSKLADKYLVLSIALNITDLSEFTNISEKNYDLIELLNETVSLQKFSNGFNLERDQKSENLLNLFKNKLDDYTDTYLDRTYDYYRFTKTATFTGDDHFR